MTSKISDNLKPTQESSKSAAQDKPTDNPTVSPQAAEVSKVAAASILGTQEESNIKNRAWEDFEANMMPYFSKTIPLPNLRIPNNSMFKTNKLFSLSIQNFITTTGSYYAFTMDLLENASIHSSDLEAGLIRQTLSLALSRLPSMWHYQQFIHNPPIYTKQFYKQTFQETFAKSLTKIPANNSIEQLILKGQNLLQRIGERTLWLVLQMPKPCPEMYAKCLASIIKVINTDHSCRDDAIKFIKECSSKFAEMEKKNPHKFTALEQFQKTKGILWPHSKELLNTIQLAHFVWKPTSFIHDYCVCETCKVKVPGWRAWYNPWRLHDYSKHPPEFQGFSAEQRKIQLRTKFASFAKVLTVVTMPSEGKVPWTNQTYYVMENKNKQSLMISSFQLSEFVRQGEYSSLGVEILMECPKSDIASIDTIENSWLFDLVHELSHRIAAKDSDFKSLTQGVIFRHIDGNGIDIPAKYKHKNGVLTVLVGIKSPLIPEFLDENEEGGFVHLVKARLLTTAEWEEIKDKRQEGCQLLMERFTKDQTYHMSTISTEENAKSSAATTTSSKIGS